jgi:hypothetical protein
MLLPTNSKSRTKTMITTTNHIDRTEAEMTQLRSLDQIRQRKQELHRLRKISQSEARKPTAPLSVQVATMKARATPGKTTVSIETLEQMDSIYNIAERLGQQTPLDAIPIARGLLASLLRLSYARVQGKPRTNPEPNMVPMKLFQKGILTKTVMRRMKHSIEKSCSASDLLECCRALMVYLASDPDSLVGVNARPA